MKVSLLFLVSIFSFVDFISSRIYTCNRTTSCGCSTSTLVTSRIVGGEFAPANAWGWMVSLSRNGQHICGASLISDSYAITAAHCVDGYVDRPSIFAILAGTNYLYDTTSTTIQGRIVTTIINHPNYISITNENDIAILVFSPLTISTDSRLSVICLPDINVDPFQIDTSLVATGWGVTSQGDYAVSSYLQQVTVQVFPLTSTDCMQSGIPNTGTAFCAGISGGGKDTCQGDSGGPLMAFVDNRWVLAGITSSGYGCARPGFPGVYTRVSAFISFISSNVGVNVTTTTGSSSVRTVTTGGVTNSLLSNNPIIDGNHGNTMRHSMSIMMICLVFMLRFRS